MYNTIVSDGLCCILRCCTEACFITSYRIVPFSIVSHRICVDTRSQREKMTQETRRHRNLGKLQGPEVSRPRNRPLRKRLSPSHGNTRCSSRGSAKTIEHGPPREKRRPKPAATPRTRALRSTRTRKEGGDGRKLDRPRRFSLVALSSQDLMLALHNYTLLRLAEPFHHLSQCAANAVGLVRLVRLAVYSCVRPA